MIENTLKVGDVEVNKKEFHASKQPIALNLVDINQIVTFNKFKQSNKSSKYFIGYKRDDIIRSLCIDLLQMSRHIKYVDNGGRNVSCVIEDDVIEVCW